MYDYLLAVLTHGDGATLDETLFSFAEHVSLPPTEVVMFRDAPTRPPPEPPWEEYAEVGAGIEEQLGFCQATRLLWHTVMEYRTIPFVFWLEHDFRFVRDVELEPMMSVLLSTPQVPQLALMRDAVNGAEKAAGGLYEFHAGEGRYTPQKAVHEGREYPWLEHDICLTTNPSLMRRPWMLANPWPETYESECEGRFSGDLRRAGYRFGHWGAGEVYVEHIGTRDGFGY